MDFGLALRTGWADLRRYPALVVLGLLVGGCSQELQVFVGVPQNLSDAGYSVTAWVDGYIVVMSVLNLVWPVVAVMATTGLMVGTLELARDRPCGIARAWRDGLHYFWSYLAMMILLGLGLVVLMACPAIALGSSGGGSIASLVQRAFSAAVVVLGLLLSSVTALAMRILVVETLGVVGSVSSAFDLVRFNRGAGLPAFLVQLGLALAKPAIYYLLGLGAAVVCAEVDQRLGQPAGGLAAVFGGLAAVGLAWLAGGVLETYVAGFWTSVYTQLRGQEWERYGRLRADR